jgi:hypothetical protein
MSYIATKMTKITKSDTDDVPDKMAFGLAVGTAGTANIIRADGVELADYPLFAGYNPIKVKRIKTGGTADDIWALS